MNVFISRASVLSVMLASALVARAQWDAAVWVERPASINGLLDGSLRQMSAGSFSLHGGARITRDLLVPGRPEVRLNGNPTYDGTVDLGRSAGLSSQVVTLNGNASLRHVVRGVDGGSFPAVVSAMGAREGIDVEMRGSETVVEWPRVRDIAVDEGTVAIPAGVYGRCTVRSRGVIRLGTAGDTVAAVYEFTELALGGRSRLEVAGPVLLRVERGISGDGEIGSGEAPRFLEVQVASGDIVLAGGARFHGYALAPYGAVVLKGNAEWVGGVIARELDIGGNAVLRVVPRDSANLAPVVELILPQDGLRIERAPAGVELEAAAIDWDGEVERVEFFAENRQIAISRQTPFKANVTLPAGIHRIRARAYDNLAAVTESAEVVVRIGENLAPLVSLKLPRHGTVVHAPALIDLEAEAEDLDGDVAHVEFLENDVRFLQDDLVPFATSRTMSDPGTYTFAARATDDAGLAVTSEPVVVTVLAENQSPGVALASPRHGSAYQAPALVTLRAEAADPDGEISGVEFFEGLSLLGATSEPPYELEVDLTEAREYAFIARATDDLGSSTDSAAVIVSVSAPETLPEVRVTQPQGGEVFLAWTEIPILVEAEAATEGPVNVAILANGVPLGPVSTAPYSVLWRPTLGGSYSVTAIATDAAGRTRTSDPVMVTVLEEPASVPMHTSFESSEDFAVGVLSSLSWRHTGSVVVNADSLTGRQHLALSGDTATVTRQLYGPSFGVVFVDALIQPVAGWIVEEAAQLRTSMSCVAFVREGDVGRIVVRSAGVWLATSATVPLAEDSRARDWIRITTREDYEEGFWDLYINGSMVAARLDSAGDLGDRLQFVTVTGAGPGLVLVEEISITTENPIGADSDRDGMLDDWESFNGLDSSLHDRYRDPDGDGVSNIQEYVLGTDPRDADTDGDTFDDGWEFERGTIASEDDGFEDYDGDGLSNAEEYALGTHPNDDDSDGDGLSDGWEAAHGTDPAADDAADDLDLDGRSNLEEMRAGSDPNDYYDGVLPEVTSLVGPDGELGPEGEISVLLENDDGEPLVNAPFTFKAKEGGHLLAASPTSPSAEEVTVRSGVDGIARAWVRGGIR